jgi:hypothetical protein
MFQKDTFSRHFFLQGIDPNILLPPVDSGVPKEEVSGSMLSKDNTYVLKCSIFSFTHLSVMLEIESTYVCHQCSVYAMCSICKKSFDSEEHFQTVMSIAQQMLMLIHIQTFSCFFFLIFDFESEYFYPLFISQSL